MRRLLIALSLLAGADARAGDSRDPSEGAPETTLRPISVEGGVASGDGVAVTVDADRRAAHVVARFLVDASPGEHAIALETPPTGVIARWNGALLPLERTELPCAPTDGESIGIDPASGAGYPVDGARAAPCEGKRALVTVGDSGRGLLELEHDLSAGYDRLRRRRTLPEVTHLAARRGDFFVYHFALRGPSGAVTLKLPPRTDGKSRWDRDLLRIAVSESRRVPLGLTALVGTALDPSGLKLAVRVTLDALLPWGDVVALGADGDHTLRASTSLSYQLHSRWIAFLPIGAHLEAGLVVDVNPRVRAGARFGIGGHFNWIGTQFLLDLFDRATVDGGPVDWRVSWVSGIGF